LGTAENLGILTFDAASTALSGHARG